MRISLLLASLLLAAFVHAQKESPFKKFGKITTADLEKKVYSIDSSAAAVVLSDIGSAEISGNSKSWFSLQFRRHRVVHVLNKNGYDFSNVEINLFTNGDDEEKLENLKAITYNLVGGKVVETKLEKAAIFKEKVSANRVRVKFTFPNVKEGSIIAYEYNVVSDYIWNLDPWYFQTSCPTLWSEFNFMVPEFFLYSTEARSYYPLAINERKDGRQTFTLRDSRSTQATETQSFMAGVTDYRWAIHNLPALKPEPFTFTTENHRARMLFQLTAQTHPLQSHNYRTNWSTFTKTMLESEHFGRAIGAGNNWMNDDIKPVVNSSTTSIDKAYRIFTYVRDNIACTGLGGVHLSQSLKNVLKNKKGTVPDVNLLLTAMLRHEGIQADPVIVGTTWNGYTVEVFPTSTHYNYVIVRCVLDGKVFYLDATNRLLGFGRLMPYCYNGHARVISEEGRPVYFRADSLRESKQSLIIVSTDDSGKWKGSVTQTLGYYESLNIRDEVKEKGKEALFKKIEKGLGFDATIDDHGIDSLWKVDVPLKLRYQFTANPNDADLLYINPLFGEGHPKNPFAAAERNFPVEMPYTKDETIVVNMEIPKGYVVEELPKQMVAKFDEEGKTFFEYRISQSENNISFRCRIKIDRAFFMPDEYEVLREFYNLLVKKQNEQIVFRKKK